MIVIPGGTIQVNNRKIKIKITDSIKISFRNVYKDTLYKRQKIEYFYECTKEKNCIVFLVA